MHNDFGIISIHACNIYLIKLSGQPEQSLTWFCIPKKLANNFLSVKVICICNGILVHARGERYLTRRISDLVYTLTAKTGISNLCLINSRIRWKDISNTHIIIVQNLFKFRFSQYDELSAMYNSSREIDDWKPQHEQFSNSQQAQLAIHHHPIWLKRKKAACEQILQI